MIDEIHLISHSIVRIDGRDYACRIGQGGIAAEGQKHEGDLKTPTGSFALRCCYYRPDRLAVPVTQLPVIALTPQDAWCDDPSHAAYNTAVTLPFSARHEKLWREDHVYDLIIPLGYNDGPIVSGMGSAIFMHLMREDGVGTEGCIALKLPDLLEILRRSSVETRVVVSSDIPV